MSNPIAILVADVHYSLPTLALADAAMRQAIDKANSLEVPLIVAGDLHCTKANVRGECIKAMRETFKLAKITPRVLRGNHDQIHEKSKEHSLIFLEDLVILIDEPSDLGIVPKMYGIPYHHDIEELREVLKTIPKGATIIMHQGLVGSDGGEYIQDKSAITFGDVKDFTVISGHYHKRQTLYTGAGKTFSYVGNPYTLNFAEANDPEKGYQILMEDASLEFVPTNLRKHLIVKVFVDSHSFEYVTPNTQDIVWVKAYGKKENLLKINKKMLKNWNIDLQRVTDFKLDLIPLETKTETAKKQLENSELLDSLIESLTNTTEERKQRLKTLWKTL